MRPPQHTPRPPWTGWHTVGYGLSSTVRAPYRDADIYPRADDTGAVIAWRAVVTAIDGQGTRTTLLDEVYPERIAAIRAAETAMGVDALLLAR